MCDRSSTINATPPRCLRCCSPCCDPCPSCPPDCCQPCVEYCIFDLETAVFDTRHIYVRACRELLARHDKTLPDDVLMQCGPMETHEMAQLICRKLNLRMPWEIFLVQLNDLTGHLIANPPLMEGAEHLINHLHEECIGLALITASNRSLFCKKILGREELFAKFDHILCADEYNRPKPDPDCYLLAMNLLCDQPSPECFLAFDGTVKGVQAAREAHLKVIMLPDADLPCCWSELATERLETLLEFDPEDYGMPYLEPLPPPPPPPPQSTPPIAPNSRRPSENKAQQTELPKTEEEIVTSGQEDEEPPVEQPAN